MVGETLIPFGNDNKEAERRSRSSMGAFGLYLGYELSRFRPRAE